MKNQKISGEGEIVRLILALALGGFLLLYLPDWRFALGITYLLWFTFEMEPWESLTLTHLLTRLTVALSITDVVILLIAMQVDDIGELWVTLGCTVFLAGIPYTILSWLDHLPRLRTLGETLVFILLALLFISMGT